ncbi:T9SS type A sorting domain-containing protein [Owenweeksia hongkongensis]|uniref:MAM domain protein n=1 Tax=Owenweeksia hongkongensis (strain DSM 17368 / CIP 108786 / JCM 12287 / NRRL B-23963 / UST20020801) TaxID=926562 RepID=G8R3X7_OWEHD|nr:T9SS type A sorting domain-containing protein [Owenweeksia hongkongensis]AEV32009.1 MAM domain protein [Owenweeksia hongkongensis DSM 17368]
MRKFLLLFSISLFAFAASAQKDTLYFNSFENIPTDSSDAQVTQGVSIAGTQGTPPKWAVIDTFGYNSNNSYHVKGKLAGHTVHMQTDTIDATGKPYISFSFWNIAKLYSTNQASLDYTIDGGQTWANIPLATTYQGASPNYQTLGYFNQVSYANLNDIWKGDPVNGDPYATPLPSWWQKETYDLSDVLSDIANNIGYDSIMIRFKVGFLFPININTTNYASGWFVDDILVTGAPCELNPPKINFAFSPQGVPGGPSCFAPNPEGGQTELVSTNYPVAARVTDAAKSYDTGVDSVYVVYKVNGGTLDTFGLDLINSTNGEYRGFFNSLAVGDNVDWYMMAYDKSCPPNETRMPDITYNGNGFYNFFIEKGLPGKCGAPSCNIAPDVIRTFPWTENFDGPNWVIGAGGNDKGTTPNIYWNRNYQGNSTPPNVFGWTVGAGGTPSQYTGPSADHTTGGPAGKYMYVETDGTIQGGAPALFTTPCIDLTNQTGCLGFEFYYHMFGSDIGELLVDIDTGQGIVSIPADRVTGYKILKDEQQNSSTAAWKRAVFSLNDFVGKYITVRFRVRPTGGSYPLKRGDLAIDDLSIFTPNPVDVEVLANPEPKNGYCDFAGQPVDIVIRNNGCDSLSSVPVRYKLSSSATVYQETATLSPALQLGDTATYTFTNLFPTIAPGSHQVTAWSAAVGDADNDNDTAMGDQLLYELPITTFPFIENFENGTVGTQNLGNNNWHFDDGLNTNFKWQVDEEMTTERATGPYSGYHFEGKYLYAESNGTSGGLSTFLRTLCLDLSTMGTGHNAVLDFYYHMYGADIDKLQIQVSEGDEPIDVWTTVSTINGAGQQSKELDNWKLHRVDLSSYSGSIKIRFAAIRKGAGNKTNLAIDKIMIYDRDANDAGGFAIINPGARGAVAGPSGTSDPQVSIANFGNTTLNTCTVNFRITPLCGNSAPTTYQYYYNGPSIAQGTVKTVDMSSAGVVYPIGEFEACVFVTSPNGSADNIAFNDTICRNIIGGNNRYDIAWFTDFDTCDYDDKGFSPQNSGFWQWEKGKPSLATSGLITDDRTGGGNAWVTNLEGDFLVGTKEWLRTPVYEEFDTVVNAKLNFYMNLNFGSNGGTGGTNYNVAATCYYFNQGWQILGENTIAANLGKNWYGGANGQPSINLLNGGPGWTGGTGDGTWIETEYPLNQFNLDSNAALTLRFEFTSDPGMQQSAARGGMGIDDFQIIIPEQNSVSPTKVTTLSPLPLPGFDQQLRISVKNTAEKVIDSFQVYVEVDNVPLGPIHWVQCGKLGKDQTYRWTYKYPWLGASVTSGPHNVCVYTSRPDNKPDQKPYDDTLCDNIPVMLELDFTATGQDEYCEDFESATTFQWLHKDAIDLFDKDECWEKGPPSQITAHSGANAWAVTDTFKDSHTGKFGYDNLEQAALFTPVFEVDSGIQYKLEFYHWMQSEKYHDGGNVEYSFDGGISWYPIGYRQKGVNTWYNTDFVTALDQIRGGWTDTTSGWQNAIQRIVFQDHGKVILRFRFGSDYDLTGKGWVIDDFCWTKDTSSAKPNVIIGEDEYQLPVEAIVGDMVPNPATDYSDLSFIFPTPQDVEIRVYNIVGQLMESRSASFGEGVNRVSFSTVDWSAGVYFVNFEYGGKLVTRKLVVK